MGYIGIMENKMETLGPLTGYIGYILLRETVLFRVEGLGFKGFRD